MQIRYCLELNITMTRVETIIHSDFFIDGPYEIDATGKLLVAGNVHVREHVRKLRLKFSEVNGYFSCAQGNLETLLGSPEKVGGHFCCNDTRITSLAGGPKYVGEAFDCSGTSITSLEYAPRDARSLDCSNTRVKSLIGCPRHLEIFDCSSTAITSLVGGPVEVTSGYTAANLQLASLKGAPKIATRFFQVDYNYNLDFLPVTEIVSNWMIVDFAAAKFTKIIQKWTGMGPKAKLALASELISAGYARNAG